MFESRHFTIITSLNARTRYDMEPYHVLSMMIYCRFMSCMCISKASKCLIITRSDLS